VVNSELVLLYWRVGQRVRQDVLNDQRAEYGQGIISALSRQLTQEYGNGFSKKSLRHMIRFAEVFPGEQIVSALPRQLGWSHLLEILYLAEPLQREFYIAMCRLERWSIRTLRERIRGMLYERTALSKKPAKVIEGDLKALKEDGRLTPDLVFRDPYFLDFLGLHGEYKEKDLEAAIVRELERFILFYHRRLRRLIAIDLKLGKFQAADKGQMDLYLRWRDKHERQAGEERPIGLILRAGKTAEHVELLQLEQAGIRVAEYMTELPPRELLERKLHEAIQIARYRLETKAL
jgi:predicted nuclease of restriction endonuclease-like (RecB) superfamily